MRSLHKVLAGTDYVLANPLLKSRHLHTSFHKLWHNCEKHHIKLLGFLLCDTWLCHFKILPPEFLITVIVTAITRATYYCITE